MATTDYSLKARSEILDYEKKYKVKKNIGTKDKPKWVDWDNKTNKAWNQKIVTDAKKKLLFGSKTPLADKKYEAALYKLKRLEHDTYNTLASKIRRRFSPRTDVEGERVIDTARALRIQNAKAELNKLKIGTKYARDEKAAASEALLNNLPVEDKVDIEQTAQIDKAKRKLDGNTKPTNNQPIIPGQEVGRGTWVNGRWVDQGTNKPLMSSFREDSSDQARNNLKVKQDAGETIYKSDVHTIDPKTNKPLGVMTRAERRQWDIDNQQHLKEWANKPGHELRIYKNRKGAG